VVPRPPGTATGGDEGCRGAAAGGHGGGSAVQIWAQHGPIWVFGLSHFVVVRSATSVSRQVLDVHEVEDEGGLRVLDAYKMHT
jgi:hypothetical protein